MCRDGASPPHETSTAPSNTAHHEQAPPYAAPRPASLYFPPHGPLGATENTSGPSSEDGPAPVRRMLFLNICEALRGPQSPFPDLSPRGVLRLRAALVPISPALSLVCKEHPQASKLTSQDTSTAGHPPHPGDGFPYLRGSWWYQARSQGPSPSLA